MSSGLLLVAECVWEERGNAMTIKVLKTMKAIKYVKASILNATVNIGWVAMKYNIICGKGYSYTRLRPYCLWGEGPPTQSSTHNLLTAQHTLLTGDMQVSFLFSLPRPSCNLLLFVPSPTRLLTSRFLLGVTSLATPPPEFSLITVTVEVNWCTKERPSVGVRGLTAWACEAAPNGSLATVAVSTHPTEQGSDETAEEGVVKKVLMDGDWRSG